MRIGVFADTHDHLDNIRRAVHEFNRMGCQYVLFAGDLVSTFAIPPLRKLECPLIASFGDNEGNKVGIYGGMEIIGEIGEPPFGICLPDGTRVLLTHQLELLRGQFDGADIVVYAHSHRPRIYTDESGRLFVNPGESSGWTYRRPTIALIDTVAREAELIDLCERPQTEDATRS